MAKLLLTSLFIVVTIGNSLAAVSPHLEGDGGCAMSCCQAAHDDGQHALLSKICCKFDCKQPADTTTSSSANSIILAQHKVSADAHFIFAIENTQYIKHARFPKSPTRNIAGSSNRFLETGSLLI
jgi:hypothetical protein